MSSSNSEEENESEQPFIDQIHALLAVEGMYSSKLRHEESRKIAKQLLQVLKEWIAHEKTPNVRPPPAPPQLRQRRQQPQPPPLPPLLPINPQQQFVEGEEMKFPGFFPINENQDAPKEPTGIHALPTGADVLNELQLQEKIRLAREKFNRVNFKPGTRAQRAYTQNFVDVISQVLELLARDKSIRSSRDKTRMKNVKLNKKIVKPPISFFNLTFRGKDDLGLFFNDIDGLLSNTFHSETVSYHSYKNHSVTIFDQTILMFRERICKAPSCTACVLIKQSDPLTYCKKKEDHVCVTKKKFVKNERKRKRESDGEDDSPKEKRQKTQPNSPTPPPIANLTPLQPQSNNINLTKPIPELRVMACEQIGLLGNSDYIYRLGFSCYLLKRTLFSPYPLRTLCVDFVDNDVGVVVVGDSPRQNRTASRQMVMPNMKSVDPKTESFDIFKEPYFFVDFFATPHEKNFRLFVKIRDVTCYVSFSRNFRPPPPLRVQ